MRRILIITLYIVLSGSILAHADQGTPRKPNQTPVKMNNEHLGKLIHKIAEKVKVLGVGAWRVELEGEQILILTSERRNRMRMMIPIRNSRGITTKEMKRMMQANFDTTMDARYAIASNKLWSVYIHPFVTMTESEFLSALVQVINVKNTYGKTYTAGILAFRGGDSTEINRELYKKLKRRSGAI